MTRAYLDIKRYERAYKEVFNKLKANNELVAASDIEKTIQEYMNDPVFGAAARLTRFLSADAKKFQDEVWRAIINLNISTDGQQPFDSQPILTFGKAPDSVYVYPGVVVNQQQHQIMRGISFCTNQEALKDFYSSYKEDMKDEKRAQAWVPFSRAWKKLKRREEVSIATALTRYTSLPKVLRPSQIRDVASYILDTRQPMQLIYADKPEDFIVMYERGPSSCMNNKNAASFHWDMIMFPNGHHPCSFFAYHPYVRGVYSKQGNEVAARTYIYQYEDGKWKYGRLYSINPVAQQKFEESLKAAGYEFMGPHEYNKYARNIKFDIPAIVTKDVIARREDYILPWPFMDNMENSIHIGWDAEKKVFNIECASDLIPYSNRLTKGYTTARVLTEPVCAYCGEDANRNDRKQVAVNGTMFCHPDHVAAAGYCWAYRSDGEKVIVTNGSVYPDPYTGHNYTNKEAAIACGCLPIIQRDCEEEDDEVTSVGLVVRKNGQLYKCPEVRESDGGPGLHEYFTSTREILQGHFHRNSAYIWEPKVKEEFMGAAKITTQRVVEFDTLDPIVVAA